MSKSIETNEELTDRLELYDLLQQGLDDVKEGRTQPFSEAMAEIRAKRKRNPRQ